MKMIKIKTQFEGFHSYKDAPKQVAFLRNQHRHLFQVICCIEVTNNDRELEFFIVQKVINQLIKPLQNKMVGSGSCEDAAEYLVHKLQKRYRGRKISVEVNEDGENGSIVCE